MNSLLLGLALSGSPTAAAQPPVLPPPVPPGTPLVGPHRPGYPYPARPVYQPGPSHYPPVFAPGEPTPGYPHHPGHHGPMTLTQFAKCFHPTPGHHAVWLIHPVTCRPVKVCFDLPHGFGCPKIDVDRRSIEFDYGKREIEIEFCRNGTYEVDYD